MTHEIEQHPAFVEVRLSPGQKTKNDILQIVGGLIRIDPNKDLHDLWILAEDTLAPLADLIEVAETIKKRLPPDSTGRKTAFVVTDQFQKAQAELYVSEASILKLDIQLFDSRDDAVAWILSG